jgi:glycosyltransferase involved in cell wall biosynthesis
MADQSNHIKYESGSRESEVALSVITPAYNEADNLPQLYQRLKNVLSSTELIWEWIIVDDHSTDNTFSQIKALRDSDSRIKGWRFARNSGSHVAIFCGLEHAKGKCAVVLAADLQDPPESIPMLLNEWKQGSRVVWAARANRMGVRKRDLLFSKLFFFMMRNIIGIKNMPASGADFFLIDKKVIRSLLGTWKFRLEFAEEDQNCFRLDYLLFVFSDPCNVGSRFLYFYNGLYICCSGYMECAGWKPSPGMGVFDDCDSCCRWFSNANDGSFGRVHMASSR